MAIIRKMKELYKRILTVIGGSQIGDKTASFLQATASIMMAESGRKRKNELSERLMVKNLIHNVLEKNMIIEKEVACINNEKLNDLTGIKIRIVHCAPKFFFGIKTICEAFNNDVKYNLRVILTHEAGSSYELARQMESEGIEYVFENEYDFSIDNPDITIFYLLEYNYTKKILEARTYSKLLVLVPQTLTTIWYGERTVSRLHLDKYQPDFVFATKLAIDKLQETASTYKFIEMVPPRLDIIYRNLKKAVYYPKGWDKLKGKKVILYMSDHGLTQYSTSDEMTFDLYLPVLMDYFTAPKNDEVALIIRPHFVLIRELLAYFWDLGDYRSFVNYCEQSPNIVWDESPDFSLALSLCDAVLSDVNSSVTYFSLAAKKPVGVPLRYDMTVKLFNKEFTYGLHAVESKEECIQFLDMVKEGKNMEENVKKMFDNYIAPFDGKNGQRVKEKIESEYAKII